MNTETSLKEKLELALSHIRPYLQADGGDIQLHEVTDDLVVKVKFLGACSSCPMSMHTLRAGVEQSIKRYAPEIRKVEDITEV